MDESELGNSRHVRCIVYAGGYLEGMVLSSDGPGCRMMVDDFH